MHATLARSCLKHYLTRILADLMESQQENGHSFQRLFDLVSHLRRAQYVSVFVTPACTLDRCALALALASSLLSLFSLAIYSCPPRI